MHEARKTHIWRQLWNWQWRRCRSASCLHVFPYFSSGDFLVTLHANDDEWNWNWFFVPHSSEFAGCCVRNPRASQTRKHILCKILIAFRSATSARSSVPLTYCSISCYHATQWQCDSANNESHRIAFTSAFDVAMMLAAWQPRVLAKSCLAIAWDAHFVIDLCT